MVLEERSCFGGTNARLTREGRSPVRWSVALTGMLCLIFWADTGQADTVYFNDANRNSAGTLQIGGVTITSTTSGLSNGSGQPYTVQGTGLGLNSGIGQSGEVDEQAFFPAGDAEATSLSGGGGLGFQVNGWINSITIMPVLRSLDSGGAKLPIPDNVNMEFSLFESGSLMSANNLWPTFTYNSATTPITFNSQSSPGSSTWYITPQLNSDPSNWYSSCRAGNESQDQTLQWGFTVLSLDFTPAPVPEPAAVTVMAIGLIGLVRLQRRMSNARPGLNTAELKLQIISKHHNSANRMKSGETLNII